MLSTKKEITDGLPAITSGFLVDLDGRENGVLDYNARLHVEANYLLRAVMKDWVVGTGKHALTNGVPNFKAWINGGLRALAQKLRDKYSWPQTVDQITADLWFEIEEMLRDAGVNPAYVK